MIWELNMAYFSLKSGGKSMQERLGLFPLRGLYQIPEANSLVECHISEVTEIGLNVEKTR
jgi:hypothetical protein